MKLERTKQTVRNSVWTLAGQIVYRVLPFGVRTVLIYRLGADYSGLGGLFASILSVLSLAELGLKDAIIFSMYKPVAEDNHESTGALLSLNRKIYKIIGSVILGAGLAVMPFLKYLIKGSAPSDINIYVIYLIILGDTVTSYFMFAYKSTLLTVYQRQDILQKNRIAAYIVLYTVQIFVLLTFKNYYIYSVLHPLSTIALNLMDAKMADKLFPHIKCKGTVSPEKIQEIKKSMKGLIISRITGATRNSLDNIIVSSYLGLTMVAVYNNYYYIMVAVIGLLSSITSSMLAGVGNKIALETPETNYRDFNKFNMLYMWISGWCTICLLCLYQPFMKLWVGDDLTLPTFPMILFCAYFLRLKMGDMNSIYYSAAGLWYEGRFRYLLEMVMNLTLNLVLGYYFGVAGIVGATIISVTLVSFYGSGILFRSYFTGHKVTEYWLISVQYVIIIAVTAGVTCYVCSLIPEWAGKGGLVLTLIFRVFICIASNFILWPLFSRTKWYPDAKEFVVSIIKMRKRSVA